MKIGYGYPDDEKRLRKAGCERLFIDAPDSDRAARADMLGPMGAREGDTLVMADGGRIGRGREVPAIREALGARGVAIEIVPIETEPGAVGRPSVFNPDAEQDAAIEGLYRSPYHLSYVLKEAARIMDGWKVKRHHLTHRYGARWPDAK